MTSRTKKAIGKTDMPIKRELSKLRKEITVKAIFSHHYQTIKGITIKVMSPLNL